MQQLGGIHFIQLVADLRPQAAEPRENAVKQGDRSGRGHPQPQRTALAKLAVARFLDCKAFQRQNVFGTLVEELSRIGQSLAAGGALQKLHAKLALQRPELVAQHGLCNKKLAGCRGHVAAFHNFDKAV